MANNSNEARLLLAIGLSKITINSVPERQLGYMRSQKQHSVKYAPAGLHDVIVTRGHSEPLNAHKQLGWRQANLA